MGDPLVLWHLVTDGEESECTIEQIGEGGFQLVLRVGPASSVVENSPDPRHLVELADRLYCQLELRHTVLPVLA